uniref:Uncharacterized protein n=1 Tax=Arundo donax TaxID=35708 RepID=A0A0A9FMT7_ARUDO
MYSDDGRNPHLAFISTAMQQPPFGLPENKEWSAIRRAASALLSIELAFTLQVGRLLSTFFSTSSRKSLETRTRIYPTVNMIGTQMLAHNVHCIGLSQAILFNRLNQFWDMAPQKLLIT